MMDYEKDTLIFWIYAKGIGVSVLVWDQHRFLFVCFSDLLLESLRTLRTDDGSLISFGPLSPWLCHSFECGGYHPMYVGT